MWDEVDDDDPSPICADCGVSGLPPEIPGDAARCENPDCDAYGQPIG